MVEPLPIIREALGLRSLALGQGGSSAGREKEGGKLACLVCYFNPSAAL